MNNYKVYLDSENAVVVQADEVRDYGEEYTFWLLTPVGGTLPSRCIARFVKINICGFVLL